MLKLAARLAPIALMAVPLWIYRNHFEDVDRSFSWRQHTYEARGTIERIGRHACLTPRPDLLEGDIGSFAVTTGDNPAQVRRAGAMLEAIGRDDRAALGRLVDEALAEEDRLLVVRSATATTRLSEVRVLADVVFGLGILIVTARELIDFFQRRRPVAVATPPTPFPSPVATHTEADYIDMVNRVNALQAMLAIHDARSLRDRAYADVFHLIDGLHLREGESPRDGGPDA